MSMTVAMVVVGITVTTTVLLLLALAAPDRGRSTGAASDDDRRPRIRLLSQVLFARRQRDAITIDCLLVSVEDAAPGVGAPAGLPSWPGPRTAPASATRPGCRRRWRRPAPRPADRCEGHR